MSSIIEIIDEATGEVIATFTSTEEAHAAGYERCEVCGTWKRADGMIEHNGKLYCSLDCLEDAGFMECAECGEIIPITEAIKTADGDYICADCMDTYYYTCSKCGGIFRIEDGYYSTHEDPDGNYICDNCFDDYCFICDCCDSVHWDSEKVYIEDTGEAVCEDCAENSGDYFLCEDCGYWYSMDRNYNDPYIEGIGRRELCNNCLDENYHYCDNCGNYYCDDDWDYDYDMCISCAEEERHDSELIWDYHDRPDIEYFGKKTHNAKNWRGIGIELEIDSDDYCNNDNCAQAIKDVFNDYVYFNHDGSLNYGFEIISQPATIDRFNTMDWERVLEICRNYEYKSHDTDTCGLHVHISRTLFGSTRAAQKRAIAKLIRFYDIFFNDIVKVSRRNEAELHWTKRHYTSSRKEAEEIAAGNAHRDRYYCVNTTNYNTIEIRIMKGTLKAESFRACIDFITRTAMNSKRITWKAIDNAAAWLHGIKDNTKKYIISRGAFSAALGGATCA